MTIAFAESTVEAAALEWFEGLGYAVLYGPDIAPGEPKAERASYGDVVLEERLRQAIARLNPVLPSEAREEALRKVLRAESPSLVVNNRSFHRMFTDGAQIEYRAAEGRIVGDQVRLVDFDEPENNDWLAVNQFTVVEGQAQRRPDVVIFVNGLPLVVIELKNPADENATLWTAFNQLQTYKQEIPSLFTFNEVLVISDGLEARVGSLTASTERFMPWRTIEGETLAPATMPQLQVLLDGIFEKRRFLDLLRHFIVFEEDTGGTIAKKLAGYHQFHAVNNAVATVVRAADPAGDRRGGVVWHTQGSGKSLTMVFYAGKIILHPEMENPTLVVLTDRNDLDGQLFDTFAANQDLLRQKPVQAGSRAELQQLLRVASGGVVFTTVQKFFPEERRDRYPLLSERRNIVFIADEAHRSQYDFIDGFARHMRDALPNATFIGFTGTPIELSDRNTRAVFGDYVSIYDVQRAVEDGATVPIYYEARMAKIELDEKERPTIDPEVEQVTEGEEEAQRERIKRKWAQLEAIVGTEKRLSLVAQDLVDHFERRQEALVGKAMVVCMSRRICVDLYNAIVALRPDWHDQDDQRGAIKVVMTGSAGDLPDWQQHIRNKPRRKALADRFRDSQDSFKIVLVRDMWLTGFDAPCLHTMYLDKPMRAHGLMQAIARVNRVFHDKPGGLAVDYLGLTDELRQAVATYTESGGTGETAINQQDAVAVMLEKYEIVSDLFHGFDYSRFVGGTPADRLSVLPAAQEHILAQEDGKARLLQAVSELTKAFALSVPHEEALRIRDDVAFFQAVRGVLAKPSASTAKAGEELDFALRQIVSRAVVPEEVVDIFSAAGLKKPDISILSDEFLEEVRGMPHRNLAAELLQKLLNDEIRTRTKRNVVEAKSFTEMLERAIRAYQNRSIQMAQLIEQLIDLAKQMREAHRRGEELGLTEEELAFYDALETNDSAVKVLGDDALRTIAQELTVTVRRNVTIDWTQRESARARLRTLVRRVLRRHGYPPDKQEKATLTVVEQAEALGLELAA